jgi:UDP-glucose 4-epimerase
MNSWRRLTIPRGTLPGTIVRLFNTVGLRQTGRYGMVIPTFVRQALFEEPIVVFADGSQTRCFAHVLDVVSQLADLVKAAGGVRVGR